MPRWSERLVLLLLAAVLLPGATSAALTTLGVAGPPPAASAEAAGVIIEPYVAPPWGPRAPASLSPEMPAAALPTIPSVPARRLYEEVQAIALYGAPNTPIMGALGRYSPDEAAREVQRLAAEWDAINGDRGAVGVLHLITAVAQPRPMTDGSYLLRLGAETISEYVEAARSHGVLLILDVQVGMADPLVEAQRLDPFLREPFVHLALDPEFAMRASRGVPGQAIGSLDASQVNPVQRYLAALVRQERIPAKTLVLHQFRDDMLTDTASYDDLVEVTRIVDMDGWGGQAVKLAHYETFALASYSQRPAIKLFYEWDEPILTAEDLLALPRIPDLVIYQ